MVNMLRRDFMAGASAAALVKPERRNVLLLICEQFQHDAGSFMGGPAKTPHLDQLAAASVRFQTACTTTGLCSPARAALFTGRLGHRTGLDDNCNVWHSRLTGLDLKQTTLIEWAKRQGYFTGYFGKWHLGLDGPIRRGADRYPASGFDRTRNPPGKVMLKPDFSAPKKYYAKGAAFEEKPGFYLTAHGSYEDSEVARLARSGAAFLEEAARQPRSFFLTVSFNAVHPPYQVAPPFHQMYDWRQVRLPANLHDSFANKPAYQNDILWPFHDTAHMSEDDWRRSIAFYRGFISQLDRGLGAILDSLRAGGWWDNTLVVLVADHGDMNGAHNRFDKGPYCYDEILRIPLLVRAPGLQPRDVRRHVSSIDLNRTLAEWMGAQPDEPNLDSRSLWPLMQRGDAAWDGPDQAFYRYEWYNGRWFGIRAIRTPDWKYCFNPAGVDALYDLKADPAEMHNLAVANPAPAVLASLQRRLLEHLRAVGDKMLAEKLEQYAAGGKP